MFPEEERGDTLRKEKMKCFHGIFGCQQSAYVLNKRICASIAHRHMSCGLSVVEFAKTQNIIILGIIAAKKNTQALPVDYTIGSACFIYTDYLPLTLLQVIAVFNLCSVNRVHQPAAFLSIFLYTQDQTWRCKNL